MSEQERDAAIELIKEWYSPFPINGIDKVPDVRFSIVSIDTMEQAQEYRWRGVGIHLGRSKCWVLDIDGDRGYAELKELTDKHGDLPETRTVKTGGGGIHYYWTGLEKIHSGILTNNIHVKGNHGNAFVVAPPTMHKSGNRYEYINRCKPVMAPEWLRKMVERDIIPTTIPQPSDKSRISEEYNLKCMEIGAPLEPHETSTGLRGSHPFHGSTSGKNFAVNQTDNTWCCYRCNSGGGALELFAVKVGIIACEDAGPGCLRGKMQAIHDALKRHGYRSEELEHGAMLMENIMRKWRK